ncbi:MAG TPA: TetR family transcriptional regulator [Pseudonocardiaceae bacterium]|nr:TetR family transcriptional regulator [Pseudonocardiaceae bacterium]
MTAGASTPKGERRRQALIESAAQLLDEGGFDAVRHRAVAERAGLPLASTTYYFDSLDVLVTAAVEHLARAELAICRARLAQLPTHPTDDEAVVELMVDAVLGPDSAGAGIEAVLPRYERFVAAGRRPWLAPLMRDLRAELDVLLTAVLAGSQRFRGLRRDGDHGEAGVIDRERLDLLVAVVDGAVVNALIEASPDPRAAARRMLLRSL